MLSRGWSMLRSHRSTLSRARSSGALSSSLAAGLSFVRSAWLAARRLFTDSHGCRHRRLNPRRRLRRRLLVCATLLLAFPLSAPADFLKGFVPGEDPSNLIGHTGPSGRIIVGTVYGIGDTLEIPDSPRACPELATISGYRLLYSSGTLPEKPVFHSWTDDVSGRHAYYLHAHSSTEFRMYSVACVTPLSDIKPLVKYQRFFCQNRDDFNAPVQWAVRPAGTANFTASGYSCTQSGPNSILLYHSSSLPSDALNVSLAASDDAEAPTGFVWPYRTYPYPWNDADTFNGNFWVMTDSVPSAYEHVYTLQLDEAAPPIGLLTTGLKSVEITPANASVTGFTFTEAGEESDQRQFGTSIDSLVASDYSGQIPRAYTHRFGLGSAPTQHGALVTQHTDTPCPFSLPRTTYTFDSTHFVDDSGTAQCAIPDFTTFPTVGSISPVRFCSHTNTSRVSVLGNSPVRCLGVAITPENLITNETSALSAPAIDALPLYLAGGRFVYPDYGELRVTVPSSSVLGSRLPWDNACVTLTTSGGSTGNVTLSGDCTCKQLLAFRYHTFRTSSTTTINTPVYTCATNRTRDDTPYGNPQAEGPDEQGPEDGGERQNCDPATEDCPDDGGEDGGGGPGGGDGDDEEGEGLEVSDFCDEDILPDFAKGLCSDVEEDLPCQTLDGEGCDDDLDAFIAAMLGECLTDPAECYITEELSDTAEGYAKALQDYVNKTYLVANVPAASPERIFLGVGSETACQDRPWTAYWTARSAYVHDDPTLAQTAQLALYDAGLSALSKLAESAAYTHIVTNLCLFYVPYTEITIDLTDIFDAASFTFDRLPGNLPTVTADASNSLPDDDQRIVLYDDSEKDTVGTGSWMLFTLGNLLYAVGIMGILWSLLRAAFV